ncbi:MAG: shikimate dehydrogenase [Bacteroidota bacterium]
MKLYGLIGYPLGHSFSQKYFTEKYQKESINDCRYELFEIPKVDDIKGILNKETDLRGFNVTIPYKEQILPYLDSIDTDAAAIGAVNVVKITDGQLKGYNTDFIGFRDTLLDLIGQRSNLKALILGTGGASKAVAYTLQKLNIDTQYVSRNPSPGNITYSDLHASEQWTKSHQLIINTTPLGTFPNTDNAPDIPYKHLSNQHFLYDLVYNPTETLFMKQGKRMGATTTNGYKMLVKQAEAAWEIWNQPA